MPARAHPCSSAAVMRAVEARKLVTRFTTLLVPAYPSLEAADENALVAF
jgi:hypothetical protein